jgi:hypothetical protein
MAVTVLLGAIGSVVGVFAGIVIVNVITSAAKGASLRVSAPTAPLK